MLELCWRVELWCIMHYISIRYKKNIRNLELDPSKVFQLKPVSFDWKETNKTDFGLIAEDVEKIYPQLISYNKDSQPEAMRYDVMSVLLLEQMRQLKSHNDALKAVVCKDHPEASICVR